MTSPEPLSSELSGPGSKSGVSPSGVSESGFSVSVSVPEEVSLITFTDALAYLDVSAEDTALTVRHSADSSAPSWSFPVLSIFVLSLSAPSTLQVTVWSGLPVPAFNSTEAGLIFTSVTVIFSFTVIFCTAVLVTPSAAYCTVTLTVPFARASDGQVMFLVTSLSVPSLHFALTTIPEASNFSPSVYTVFVGGVLILMDSSFFGAAVSLPLFTTVI